MKKRNYIIEAIEKETVVTLKYSEGQTFDIKKEDWIHFIGTIINGSYEAISTRFAI